MRYSMDQREGGQSDAVVDIGSLVFALAELLRQFMIAGNTITISPQVRRWTVFLHLIDAIITMHTYSSHQQQYIHCGRS